MAGPSTTDVTTALVAVAIAAGLTAVQGHGWPELVFYAVLLATLAWAFRLLGISLQNGKRERERAAALAAVRPAETALAAVHDERRRLSLEIAATLREALEQIRADAAAAEVGPDLDLRLRRIHERTQEATSELRRHLGLLRTPVVHTTPMSSAPRLRPSRSDAAFAGALAVLAAAESVGYGLTEDGLEWSPGSVVTTAVAAATVVGRHVALGPAVLTCAVVFGLGTLSGAPVTEGFWTLGTVGVLVWSVCARGRRTAELVGGVLLCAASVGSRMVDSPDNVLVMILVLAVSLTGGLIARGLAARADRAARRAQLREQELSRARDAAVDAERIGFARELHDVASHAVGVIAMQAGAAEMSWRRDPTAAVRHLEVLRATVEVALAELRPTEVQETTRSFADVLALVERIRAAGTSVELTVVGEVPGAVVHVVHRVVQEGLTNALRHAPGAGVAVGVVTDQRSTTVTVVDDGPGPGRASNRGYGLVGLAERVDFAGGTLHIGTGGDGTGFRISVTLPVPARRVLA